MFMCMQHALPVLSTISRWNADEGKPPPPPRRSERQRKYVYKNKNERPGHRERPVQATARLQSKWAPEHLVNIHTCVLSYVIACLDVRLVITCMPSIVPRSVPSDKGNCVAGN